MSYLRQLGMRRVVSLAFFAAAVLVLSPVRAGEPDPKILSYILPEKVEWRKSEAADTATLQGDPSKPGVYIQLVRWHPGHMSRPHIHNTDRYIRVLSGTWYMGQGTKYDPPSTFPVKEGTYVVHHADQPHYDGAKDVECLLYIVGTGPMATKSVEEK
jgi:hypothetical protein